MPEFKKNPSPFMLRSGNSPLFKMMGSSPVKKEKHFLEREKTGPVVGKSDKPITNVTKNGEGKKKQGTGIADPNYKPVSKTYTKKVAIAAGKGVQSGGGVPPEESTESKTKKEKGTWFGIGRDLGVTEAIGNVIDYLMPKR